LECIITITGMVFIHFEKYRQALYKASVHVTRGNDMRLEKSRVKYDLRKFSFSNRVVNTWNSLPNWVVSANTTNTFKARLDKFWHNQDIMLSCIAH